MKTHIRVINQQKKVRVCRAAAKRLVSFFLEHLHFPAGGVPSELSVMILDDGAIRRMKARVFGIDQVTDVIACSYSAVPGEAQPLSAEIMVNAEAALRHAKGTSTWRRELALYMAHGCDHLSGGTDRNIRERRVMRRRDLRLVSLALHAGLLRSLALPSLPTRRTPAGDTR